MMKRLLCLLLSLAMLLAAVSALAEEPAAEETAAAAETEAQAEPAVPVQLATVNGTPIYSDEYGYQAYLNYYKEMFAQYGLDEGSEEYGSYLAVFENAASMPSTSRRQRN